MMLGDITLPTALALSISTVVATLAASWGVVRFQAAQHDKRIARLDDRVEALGRELSAFKIEAVERFVTDESMGHFKSEIIGAINRLADRLDRIIDSRPAPRRTS